jgi:hypothetical protein
MLRNSQIKVTNYIHPIIDCIVGSFSVYKCKTRYKVRRNPAIAGANSESNIVPHYKEKR